MHAALVDESQAAAAQAERHRQQVDALAIDVDAIDTDGEFRQRLADLRRAIAGRIVGSDFRVEDVDALRAAMTATFEKVEVHVDDEGRVMLLPYVREEAMDIEAWTRDETVTPRRVSLHLHGGTRRRTNA